MTVTAPEYLKGVYGISRALGDKLMSSDFTFQVVGNEDLGLLFKGFSLPFVSTGEAVEVPLPLGAAGWQSSQVQINQQSPIVVMETVLGHYEKFLKALISSRNGKFNAKIYSGTPDRYYRVWTIQDCSIKADPADIDMEARQQLLVVPGTLSYMYFGESQPGPLALIAA